MLVRLGFVQEDKSYSRMYAARRRAAEDLPAQVGVRQDAHLLLQHHGQTLCKRRAPLCPACPLASGCAYARAARRGRSMDSGRRAWDGNDW